MTDDTKHRKTDNPRVPMRTCSGCRTSVPQSEVLRVGAFEGRLAPDVLRRLPGRGAWVHANFACVEKACRGGFARSFKQQVHAKAEELAEMFVSQLSGRVQGLILASHRTRHLAVGRDAVSDAIDRGGVHAILIATDMARSSEMLNLAESKRIPVLRFGTKDSLGTLLAKDQVAVLALLDPSLASAMREAVTAAASMDCSDTIKINMPISSKPDGVLESTNQGPLNETPAPSKVDVEGGPF